MKEENPKTKRNIRKSLLTSPAIRVSKQDHRPRDAVDERGHRGPSRRLLERRVIDQVVAGREQLVEDGVPHEAGGARPPRVQRRLRPEPELLRRREPLRRVLGAEVAGGLRRGRGSAASLVR